MGLDRVRTYTLAETLKVMLPLTMQFQKTLQPVSYEGCCRTWFRNETSSLIIKPSALAIALRGSKSKASASNKKTKNGSMHNHHNLTALGGSISGLDVLLQNTSNPRLSGWFTITNPSVTRPDLWIDRQFSTSVTMPATQALMVVFLGCLAAILECRTNIEDTR